MPLIALRIPPGAYRSGTDYQSKGRWRDMNHIRFFEGRIQPVGGWAQITTLQFDSAGRGIHTWRSNTAGAFAAVGTVDKLWVYDGDGIYDVTPAAFPAGNLNNVIAVGYGSGLYNSGDYSESTSGFVQPATTWSLDNFGEYLVACATHNGVIYTWGMSTGSVATAVAGAPTATSIFVTPERFLVALGAGGDPRSVQWPDQETLTTWTPTATNQAGDILVQTKGQLLQGIPCRGQSLLLTSADAHTMRYVGPEAIYSFQLAGEACGVVGPRAGIGYNGVATWMGSQAFFSFDGSGVRPMPCEVGDYVFGDINRDELFLVTCEHRAQYGEIIWRYPSADSLVSDRSVTWNYREGHWTLGALDRSCMVDANTFAYPMGTDSTGVFYEHENGWTNDGTARAAEVFLESGPIEVGDGDQVVSILQLLPDEVTAGAFAVRLATQFTPEGAVFNYGPYTLNPYTDVRVTGRQIALQIEGVRDEDARIGIFRADVRMGGQR